MAAEALPIDVDNQLLKNLISTRQDARQTAAGKYCLPVLKC
jgi:hypothetical protein